MGDGSAFGVEIAHLVSVRKQLEGAVLGVLGMAADVPDLSICGTDELPAALSALESAEYVDSEEDAARWVSRAFNLTPMTALKAGGGEPVLALTGAVMLLRGALHSLDEAKNQG
ncbi:hypothetical protein [Streptomyces abikoensis]